MSSLFSHGSVARATLRWIGRLLLVLYFAAATLILVGRHYLMPELSGQRALVEEKIGAALGVPVRLDGLAADWPGLYPHLSLTGLQIHDRAGRPALALERVEVDIGWSSLLRFALHLRRVEIFAPQIELRRALDGTLFVAGLPIPERRDGNFTAWLLEQGRISVREARIVWQDEQRGAPPLEFRHVDFELHNFGRQHGIALRAEPPTTLAGRIDLRANLMSPDLTAPANGSGRLYADLRQVDLAALSLWLDLPLEMTRGRGDLRLWLDFARLAPTGVTADLDFTDLNVRLAPELAPLDLARIRGRIAGSRADGGFVGALRDLALTTADGIALAPIDARLRLDETARRRGGELHANFIDLAALTALAEHFPLPESLRTRLHALAPSGRLADLGLAWQGAPEAPERWQVKASFADLALAASNGLPGFRGISGRLTGDERAGRLDIASRDASLDLPAVFPQPTLRFADLEAEIGWRAQAKATEWLFQRMVFANDDAQGELTGSYRYTGAGPGEIDIAAKLKNAAGNAVWRYLPLAVNEEARAWLAASLRAGRAASTTLRLKGPLAKFPFPGGRDGIFQVKGTFQGGQLDYAPGWPGIEDIDGELLFEGERMSIRAQRATLMGVALSDVHAQIADLGAPQQVLTISGQARGQTQRFLDFLEASPVGERIDHFTETMTAQGSGALDLKLVMPLSRLADTQVQGRYRFAGNRLQVLPALPPFTDVAGELAFTADRLQAQGLRARFLGQPLAVKIANAPGAAVRISAAGNLEAAALRRFYGWRALDHLSGTASWRGELTVKKPAAELRIESDLRGIAASLPEPFNKSTLEAMPLVVAGRIAPAGDIWQAQLGAAALRIEQHDDIWRGRLAIGAKADALPARGLAVTVSGARLDLDTWRAVLKDGGDEGTPTLPSLAAIDLQSGEVRLMQRNFHDVVLRATADGGEGWRCRLDSREAQGQIQWDGQGDGRITGRFKRLALPASTGVLPEEMEEPPRDLSAVNLVIDDFRHDAMAFGEVKLKAENRAGIWQTGIEMRNDAARLTGEGHWRPRRSGGAAAEMALAFQLEIDNAEKLLERLGLPDAVRRGNGRIEGDVRWNGSPFGLDLPSLSGHLKADLGKGQFKKIEPGVGRLLGVLSLQSLPRRITLDFRDIFSEGFAFDGIAGEARIERGMMMTDELRIHGPAAKILLSGRVDLAAETQDLKVRVEPALGETLAVGAMLANPLAGAAAWAAQKVLNDPLGQIFAYEYAVTGSWNDPQVAKLARQAESRPDIP